MTTRRTVWLVICGEPERGDDAAGPIAVDGLPAPILERCEIRRGSALDVETLLDIPSDAACVLVDAAIGIPPGRVVVVPLDELARPSDRVLSEAAPRSSHELPVGQVFGLVRALRGRSPAGSFVGIGAASADLGAALSPVVDRAMPEFRDAIAAEIRRLGSTA